jgi:hypothetical protein
MTSRTDLIIASRVDLILTLLPMITKFEAACALAESGVPLEVAARVLALPLERRAVLQITLAERLRSAKLGAIRSTEERSDPPQ